MPDKNNIAKLRKDNKDLLKKNSALLRLVSAQEDGLSFYKSINKFASCTAKNDKLLDSLMKFIIASLKVEAGSLLLLNSYTGLLEFKVAKGSKSEAVKKYKFALGEGIAGYVAQTGQALLVANASKNRIFKRSASKDIKYPVRNVLCVPLKINRKVIGVIELLNKMHKKKFTKEDLELLKSIAVQVCLLVHNSRLVEESERKIKEHSNLTAVSAMLNSTLDLDDLLNKIIRAAAKLLCAETSVVVLPDREKQDFYFKSTKAKSNKNITNTLKNKASEIIADRVLRNGQSLLVSDFSSDLRFKSGAKEIINFQIKSVIAAPLRVKNKIIGVVEVINKSKGKTFLPYELELLEALAEQSAVAIDNAFVHKEFQEFFLNTITALARAIESKSAATGTHIDRIDNYSMAIAEELSLNAEEKKRIRWAALFHDIGKIGIKESILQKPGKLTNVEYEEIKKHPQLGADIMKPIKQFKHVIPGILHHQERWDGKGYPSGLKNTKISIDGRVIGVADTFDAMTSDRAYQKGLPKDVALEEIKKCSGTQFDPKVVAALIAACAKGKIRLEKEDKTMLDKNNYNRSALRKSNFRLNKKSRK
ncbi:MAG: GAF domain-containing protein [Candidatus Firestonebacteria bacterium]|nr:GAF domain-containing protein [Candidatus Firestonebacteria bacterium]